jgi:hypothetical protein
MAKNLNVALTRRKSRNNLIGPGIVVVDEGIARSLTTTTAQSGIYAFEGTDGGSRPAGDKDHEDQEISKAEQHESGTKVLSVKPKMASLRPTGGINKKGSNNVGQNDN